MIFFAVCVPVVFGGEVFGGGPLPGLGPVELVAAGGAEIEAPGFSAPSFADWNGDGLDDLVVGEGGAGHPAKVRVYINLGDESGFAFADFFYVQKRGWDAQWAGSDTMGCFPRVVYWDADELPDLLVGLANGTVKALVNTGTAGEPVFTGETGLLAEWNEAELDVGGGAAPSLLDWDNDGRTDLAAGGLDGKVHVYLNCGCGGAIPPSFFTSPVEGVFAQEDGADMVVPSFVSSVEVVDLDGDGRKDILAGNAEGQLLFYANAGTDSEPVFSGYVPVESDGSPVDLVGLGYSRPFVFNLRGPVDGDAYPDVLMGASDGKVRLYRGMPMAGDMDGDGKVEGADFARFGLYWGRRECGRCGGADLTGDGEVGFADLWELAGNWLSDVR